MEVTVLRFTKSVGKGKQIGFGDVQIAESIILRGVSLIKSDDGGNFVGPPREKATNGKYYDKGWSWAYNKKEQTEESRDFANQIKVALEKAASEDVDSGGSKPKGPKKSW